MENNKYIVYALIDPRNNVIRYIGKSCSGLNRPQQHLSKTATEPRKDRKNGSLTKRQAWLKQLRLLKIKPIIKVLEVCKDDVHLIERECYWIAQYSSKLTNLTSGGEGVQGRKPWNKGLKGHPLCRGGRKPGGVPWNKGAFMKEDTKKKLSELNKNKIPGNAKPVICVDDNKEYNSTGEAAKAYGLKTGQVYDVCSGRRKRAKGLQFKYK